MTLNQFFDKFLPNFHILVLTAKAEQPEWTAEQEAKWVANIFPEAWENYEKLLDISLQSLIDKACEKQRVNCAAATGYDHRFTDGILKAEQPKIEEL